MVIYFIVPITVANVFYIQLYVQFTAEMNFLEHYWQKSGTLTSTENEHDDSKT